MIFCGDIALPDESIKIELPEILKNKKWFVNLEGSLIPSSQVDEMRSQKRVFNNLDALKQLSKTLNIVACSLANNHIEDCGSVDNTERYLEDISLKHVGTGSNLSESEKAIFVADEDLTVLSFGWDVIKCPSASATKGGVNPYKKEHVIESVKRALLTSNKLVCFFHWGYELEAYPLPYDRELAHSLIDRGVKAVIGCHAHRVQQIEFYKGKPIVYGLGNFLFPHGVYWDGRLKFPDFTKKELAFELTNNGHFISHWFEYDIIENKLNFIYSEEITPEKIDFEGRAEYSELTSKEYDKFFRSNRYHKKLLPVFMSNENNVSYAAKSLFVKYRGCLIDLLVRMNLKAKK